MIDILLIRSGLMELQTIMAKTLFRYAFEMVNK